MLRDNSPTLSSLGVSVCYSIVALSYFQGLHTSEFTFTIRTIGSTMGHSTSHKGGNSRSRNSCLTILSLLLPNSLYMSSYFEDHYIIRGPQVCPNPQRRSELFDALLS